MAIPVIPVWSIRPNWRDGILERLSWLTDIEGSTNGTEQRRALRLSPRRSFEMTFNPVDEARSYFDLFLHRLSIEEFFLPLFHDKANITAAVELGDTALAFDNTYREFETGGFAILMGQGPFNFEIVEITAQDDNGLTVEALAGDWPANTVLYPVRIATLSDESRIGALTSRVGEGTVLFTVVRANDIDEGVWSGVMYNDRAVITTEPNRRETLDLSFLRMAVTVDNDIGIPYLADEANRAFTIQLHSWMAKGRQEHAELRSMLYRLRGSSQAVWLPSFNQDVQLSRAADSADDTLDIVKIGYDYTGGAITGRNHVYFQEEELAVKIIDVGVPVTPAEERLNLEAVLGTDIPLGRYGSFLEAVRLDADEVEIQHHTDSSGTSECTVSFRSYQDERVEDEAVGGPGYGGEMAGAHRFWRLMIDENSGGGAFTQVKEIELRASKNGADQTGEDLGTAISGGDGADGVNEENWRAFDNDEGTNWGRHETGNIYVGWDYGVGIRKILLELWLKGAADYTMCPGSGTIDYSEDGIAWTPFYAFDLKCWVAQGERKIPEPAHPNKHRAWRLFIPLNSGNPTFTFVGEIEMRGTPGGADLTTLLSGDNNPAGRAIASQPNNVNAEPWRAFANDADTRYWLAIGAANQWVGYIFPDPVDIQEITVQGAFSVDGAPSSIILQWSDDETTWTTVGEWDTDWDDLSTINTLTVGG